MRIYIPAMLTDLHRFVDDETVLVRGGTAFALTPTLREQYVSDDDEQLEHIAFLDAARASLRILTGAAGDPLPTGAASRKRVVISADVDDKSVTCRPDLDCAVVRLAEETIPASCVAAVHVDLDVAGDAVTAAPLTLMARCDMRVPPRLPACLVALLLVLGLWWVCGVCMVVPLWWGRRMGLCAAGSTTLETKQMLLVLCMFLV